MDGLAASRAIVECERTTGRRPTPVVVRHCYAIVSQPVSLTRAARRR